MAVAPTKVQDRLSHLVQSRDAGQKEAALPSWVTGFEVAGWSLGDRPPRIERTRVPRARGQLDTDTLLDLDVVFEPSDFQLAIKAFMTSFLGLKSIPGLDLLPDVFSEAARRTHPHLLVRVADCQLRGTLRIRIRPGEQALFFAFAEPPQARSASAPCQRPRAECVRPMPLRWRDPCIVSLQLSPVLLSFRPFSFP